MFRRCTTCRLVFIARKADGMTCPVCVERMRARQRVREQAEVGQLELVECQPYRCRLTVAACVSRYRSTTPHGHADRCGLCRSCVVGAERSRAAG